MLKPSFFAALMLALLLTGCASTSGETSHSTTNPAPSPQPAKQTSPPQTSSTAAQEAPTKHDLPAAKTVDEDNIYFPAGGNTVDLLGTQKLRAHAQKLLNSPELVVTLIGHTDDLGSSSYNLAIAVQRIEAVIKILRALDVPKKQIRRYALGNEKAGAACKTSACRQKMRRVELSYPK